MSGEEIRGPGRPQGSTDEMRQRRRDYLIAHELGAPVAEIAARAGLSRSVIAEHIKKAREEGAGLAPVAFEAGSPRFEPAPPRRMARRTIMERAWDVADRRPVHGLGLAANYLWVRILVAIHEDGDGERLRFGDGFRFGTRDELAVMLPHKEPGEPEIDASAVVAHLIRRGRLVDTDGVDLGAPVGLGVRLGENARGEQVKGRGRKRAADDGQRPLPFPPMVVAGSEFESGEIVHFRPVKPPISPDSVSGEIPPSDPAKPVISPDTVFLADAVVVVGKTQEIQEIKNNNNNNNGAGACPVELPISPDIGRISPDTESGEIPPRVSGEIGLQRSTAHELAIALKALTPPAREPTPKDVAWVHKQLDTGYAPSFLIDVVSATMASHKGGAVSALGYFSRAVRDAAETRSGVATSGMKAPIAADPASTPPEPEAPIIGDDAGSRFARALRRVTMEERAFLKDCVPREANGDGEMLIECPTRFLRDHNRARNADRLLAVFRLENPAIRRIEFVVAGAPAG